MTSASPDLAALYVKHGDMLHRVAAATLRGSGRVEDSRDVVHDAFEEVLKGNVPDEVRDWKAFLITVVKRRALDRVKSAAVRKAGPSLDADTLVPVASDDLAEAVAAELDAERRAQQVREALAVLDARQRKVVEAFVFEERKQADIAAELGVNRSRVSQLFGEAKMLIDEELARKKAIGHG